LKSNTISVTTLQEKLKLATHFGPQGKTAVQVQHNLEFNTFPEKIMFGEEIIPCKYMEFTRYPFFECIPGSGSVEVYFCGIPEYRGLYKFEQQNEVQDIHECTILSNLEIRLSESQMLSGNELTQAQFALASLEIMFQVPAGDEMDEQMRLYNVKKEVTLQSLFEACKSGQLNEVKYLTSQFQNDKALDQALCLACENGHENIVSLLLEFPQVQQSVECWKKAFQNGHFEVMTILLKHTTTEAL